MKRKFKLRLFRMIKIRTQLGVVPWLKFGDYRFVLLKKKRSTLPIKVKTLILKQWAFRICGFMLHECMT